MKMMKCRGMTAVGLCRGGEGRPENEPENASVLGILPNGFLANVRTRCAITVKQGDKEGGSARSRRLNITDAAAGVTADEDDEVSGNDSSRAL